MNSYPCVSDNIEIFVVISTAAQIVVVLYHVILYPRAEFRYDTCTLHTDIRSVTSGNVRSIQTSASYIIFGQINNIRNDVVSKER